MTFEWDEAKRLWTIAERDLDFIDAAIVFEGSHLLGAARTVGGEDRLVAVGRIADVHVAIVFTLRGDSRRIISMRKARKDERRKYQDLFGG